jgi:CBS domain containing-hemolysin-like protein
MNLLKSNYQKIIITVLLLLLAFFSVSKIFDSFSVDSFGERYTEEGLTRSLAAFGIAKGLNGLISVVQGTEVAVEPVGVGVILTPGQILDPVNDLIERFSWVMLICTTSLGIQSILLSIFSSFYFSIAVALTLFVLVLFIWIQPQSSAVLKNIFYRLAIFLIILRFFIPLMAIASDALYKAFLEPTYIESKQQLEQSNTTIANLSDNQKINKETTDKSWFEAMSSSIDSVMESLDVDRYYEQLMVEADNLTGHIIDLIVVFTMQTILFPLIFIWLSMKLIRANFSFRFVG